MATALMPSSLPPQIARRAISPRFAIRIFLNMNGSCRSTGRVAHNCPPWQLRESKLPLLLSYSKQRHPILHRTAVIDEPLDDLARGVGFDLVHQLHRFDDAQHLSFFHRVAHAHKRRSSGRCSLVKSPNNRRLYYVQVGVIVRRRGRCSRSRFRRFGRHSSGNRWRNRSRYRRDRHRLNRWRSHLDDLRRVVCPLDVQLYIAAFNLKLGDVLLHQQLNQFFDFFLIHRNPCSLNWTVHAGCHPGRSSSHATEQSRRTLPHWKLSFSQLLVSNHDRVEMLIATPLPPTLWSPG